MDGAFSLERRWFAVKAQPRKEGLAAFQLNRQGFGAFLPVITKVVRRRNKTLHERQPFFPGYLFVRLDLDVDRWRSVNGTIGVSHLVQFGERPAPVPYGVIEDLADRADEHGEVNFDDPLKPGLGVRVVGGAFDSVLGVFLGSDGPGRVRVLMTLLAREMNVSVPRSAVMAAG